MNTELRSRIVPVIALAAVLFANSTAQGECNMGVFTDPAGTVSWMPATNFELFPIYLVLRSEDVVNAVAYDLVITPAINHRLVVVSESYGPSSNGINVRTGSGSNVGLGECAVGFGNLPILVTRLEAQIIPDAAAGGSTRFVTVSLVPNSGADPTAIQYSDCTGVLKPCPQTMNLTIDAEPLPVEAHTWSHVKALW